MTAPTPDPLSTELPTDIGWGWLDWRLMFFDGDGGDADDAPDLIPAAGAIVTATPNVQLASHLTGTTFTAGKRAIQGIIDAQGRLCRKDSASGMPVATPGLPVIATDSAALTSQGFAYEITVSHPALKIGKFSTQVSAGERVDLAKRIGQSIPPGTQVTVLTPEIRAEIEKAVASVTPTLPDDLVTADELTQALASVQVDTSGLATTERVAQVEASIPEVVLRESALLDGETITSTRLETVEKADGSTVLLLVQTTNTSREVTAEVPSGLAQGAATYDSGYVDVTSWETRNGVNAASAWLRRVGDRVTCVLYGADIASGSALIIPGDGYKIASHQDSWGDTRARGIRRHAEGTSTRPVFNAVAGGAFWPETVEGTNSAEVVLEWFTDDPAPAGS